MQLTQDLIDDLVREIVAEEHPVRVILFGSRVRGDARADSDVDVLVVADTGLAPPRRSRRLRQRLASFPLPKDILVVTPDEFERQRQVSGTVAATADREGVVVYG